MIKEAYVSFETAKLLKEKGFNEPCICYAYAENMRSYFSKPRNIDEENKDATYILLPTQQMTMRWLREEHLIHICIYPKQLTEGVIWKVDIYDEDCDISFSFSTAINKDYEEACEIAIKYCLENKI